MGKEPGQLRQELTGTWFRSFEEESDGKLVFRSPEYPFPPSRAPRPALRLDDDGAAAILSGGPTDRLEDLEGPGRWAADDSTLCLQTPQLSGEFSLEAVDPDRLVVRRRPVPDDRPESTGSDVLRRDVADSLESRPKEDPP